MHLSQKSLELSFVDSRQSPKTITSKMFKASFCNPKNCKGVLLGPVLLFSKHPYP